MKTVYPLTRCVHCGIMKDGKFMGNILTQELVHWPTIRETFQCCGVTIQPRPAHDVEIWVCKGDKDTGHGCGAQYSMDEINGVLRWDDKRKMRKRIAPIE